MSDRANSPEDYSSTYLVSFPFAAILVAMAFELGSDLFRAEEVEQKLHASEGSLYESEKRFQTTADAAPVMICMSGPDKLCTFFNKAWLEFTGRKIGQELGNGWSEGVHLDDLVTHMVQADAAVYSSEVQMSLADSLPMIEGDPVQIQQVLINLVTNAFDAMRDAPPRSRKMRIVTEHEGNAMVRVGVRDYGIGLQDETRERLFEQFFTTKEEGLGMGFAIARSIVEAHGGKLAAENVAGGGAYFYFMLQAQKGASA